LIIDGPCRSLVDQARSLVGRNLREETLQDATDLGLRTAPDESGPVDPDEIAALPEAAQRYLRFMGVADRPRERAFLARFEGRFRLRNMPWMPCEAWQYNSSRPLGRVFHMRIDFGLVLAMVGRDVYARGHGEMDGRLLGLVPVARGSGPEYDEGELVTYLNDAILLAPSMLFDGATTWSHVDADSFDVSLTDGDQTVTGHVFLDERGGVRNFATTNRFCDLGGSLERTRWTTPISGWCVVEGRRLPTRCRAVWELADHDFPYIEGRFIPGSVVYDPIPALA
jgi:hypothetical protein